jgi:dimethylargininase
MSEREPRRYGCQSMSSALSRVLIASPDPAIAHVNTAEWHYQSPIDFEIARNQFNEFTALLAESHIAPEFLPAHREGLADSVFTHDPSMITAAGAILLRMGKSIRLPERELHETFFREAGIPVLGEIVAPGTFEAGDAVWLDPVTLAVGRGFRSNSEGVAQLQRILGRAGISVESYDLPVYGGPDACLHLMSIISMVDAHIALVMRPLLPVALHQELRRRNIEIIDADLQEYQASNTISANVLAVAPRDLVMVAGFPKTQAALAEHGCRVRTFAGDELCIKAEGGPTCLTRPILRA